jgi:glyoxylase-like metal-dependent hydrolase (beta-lactamase superfamily II)
MFEVVVLLEGYASVDDEGKYHADGTVTLVRDLESQFLLVVDTGSPMDKDFILSRFKKLGLLPEDVTHVVCTHGHIDHVGNLNLFSRKKTSFILGQDWLKSDDVYETLDPRSEHENKHVLVRNEGGEIGLISTPGHTESDISVVVKNGKIRCLFCEETGNDGDHMMACHCLKDCCDSDVVIIAGDVFENEKDFESDGRSWKENSRCVENQLKSRKTVLTLADIIIPGHGGPFRTNCHA